MMAKAEKDRKIKEGPHDKGGAKEQGKALIGKVKGVRVRVRVRDRQAAVAHHRGCNRMHVHT